MGELGPNEWGGLKVLSSVGSKEYAALAQLVEYLPSKQAAIGSIPIRRSNTCLATVDAVLTDRN